MEMSGARVSNATRCTAQNSPTLDTGWEAEKRSSQVNLAKNHIERDEGTCGLTWETITRQAANRQQWRSLVEALCTT